MHGVDEAGVEKLPDGGGPAAESDVLASRRVPRPIENRPRIGVYEVERGVAKGERRTRVVGQHEYRGAERRLLAPPAAPVVVVPGAALRAEFVAAHDLGADVAGVVSREVVVEAAASAGVCAHRPARRGASPGEHAGGGGVGPTALRVPRWS